MELVGFNRVAAASLFCGFALMTKLDKKGLWL